MLVDQVGTRPRRCNQESSPRSVRFSACAPGLVANAAANIAGGCLIKGNINSKGKHIYHVPGGRWYDATSIDQSKGERWFCSEAEAQAAGWRPAMQ
jgi:hypothetical protein